MAEPQRPSSGPRALGPFAPSVYRPPSPVAEETTRPEPIRTEGMKARQRALEKRRRQETAKRLADEEEAAASWERTRSVLLKFLIVAAVVLGYWRLQVEYPDNRWPLEMVWAFMVVGLLGGLGWTVWYINRGD